GKDVKLPAGEATVGGNLGVGFSTSRLAVNLFADADMFPIASDGRGALAIGKGQGVLTMAREFTPLIGVGASIKYVTVVKGVMVETRGSYTSRYGTGSCIAL